MKRNDDWPAFLGVGCLLALGYGVLPAVLFEYTLWCFFAKDVPWYADLTGGLLTSGLLLPISFACWIARLMDAAVPFIRL